MENRMMVPQITKNRITIWSSNPSPGHIPRQNYNSKESITPTFVTALFTIAKTWKQPKCPLTDEQIKKMWHIYNGVLLSHKKEQNSGIWSNMDTTRDYHTKRSQKQQNKHDTIYMWNLKYDANEPIYKTEIDSQT